jgi:stage II sporulation protein D
LKDVLTHNKSVRWCGVGSLGLMVILLAAWAVVSGCPSSTTPTPPQQTTPPVAPPHAGPPPQSGAMRVCLTKVTRSATVSFDGPLTVLGDTDKPLAVSGNLAESTLTVSAGPVWRLGGYRVAARRLLLRGLPHGVFHVDGKAYRGDLCFYPAGASDFTAVNIVDMEDYVAGVVTAESYASFPVEALKAQAVIARTYAMFERMQHRNDDVFDVTDTTSSQVYGGMKNEIGIGRQVTDATRGLVLVFGPAGKERVFCTFFFSTCGGGTMSVRYFKRDIPEIPPLAGNVDCPWCREGSWFNWATADPKCRVVTIPRAEAWEKLRKFNPQLPADGRNVRIVVDNRDRFGRILTVKLACDTWSQPVVMLGDELRRALGAREIPSMLCEMADTGRALVFKEGHGFGHGVGLCQQGAAGMARAGRSAEAILGHYYPRAMLERAY